MQMATRWPSQWMSFRLWQRRWKEPRLWARHCSHAFGIRNLIAQAVKTAGLHWVLAVKTAGLHPVNFTGFTRNHLQGNNDTVMDWGQYGDYSSLLEDCWSSCSLLSNVCRW